MRLGVSPERRRDAATPPLAITLRILVDTGVRISEAIGLAVGDVREGYLRVTGKGGHERLVPVGRTLAPALRRYVERERPSSAASATTGTDPSGLAALGAGPNAPGPLRATNVR